MLRITVYKQASPIFFNVPEAREYLEKNGHVYTLRRKRKKGEGITMAREGTPFNFRELFQVDVRWIKDKMPVIPVVSRIWVDFDAMLDNLETLNFRAFEKGLLTDTEQVKFNDTIERLRKEMREFWMEELKEPSHMQRSY